MSKLSLDFCSLIQLGKKTERSSKRESSNFANKHLFLFPDLLFWNGLAILASTLFHRLDEEQERDRFSPLSSTLFLSFFLVVILSLVTFSSRVVYPPFSAESCDK